MTMLIHYTSKKELKEQVGKPLAYTETSMFGNEYKPTGTFCGARRPHIEGGGREFFATITMKDGVIAHIK